MKPKRASRASKIITRGIVDFLSEKGETRLLPEVADALAETLVKSRHPDEMVVSSAVALTAAQKQKLTAVFTRNTHAGPRLPVRFVIDKDLLGGFAIRINDWVLDATIAHELAKLKSQLVSV
jgi:F-type H+-transporting ATPase subunit delta